MLNMASAVQAADLSPIRSNGYSQAYQHGIHNFWLTAHFGLKKATQALIRDGIAVDKPKWIQPCFSTANLLRRRREQTGQPPSDGTAHCSRKRTHRRCYRPYFGQGELEFQDIEWQNTATRGGWQ